MKKINAAGCGGNSKCLSYFGIIKELYSKGIGFKRGAFVSGAVVMFGLYVCGYGPGEIRDVLKKMKFDWVMRWEADAENEDKLIVTRIFKGAVVLLACKTFFGGMMKRLMKKYVSWERVLNAGRIDELLVGFTTYEDLARLAPGKKSAFKAMVKLLKGDGTKEYYEKIWKTCGMFWGGIDGIYQADIQNRKLKKISDDVIDLDQLFLAAFKNPALKSLEFKINGKIYHPFDLGILNNHSNIAFMDMPVEEFYQFACDSIPSDVFNEGITEPSDYIFNKHRTVNNCVVLPKAARAFISYTDKALDEEFLGQEETKFFN